MMPVEDIHIQLVDLPPVAPEIYKPWIGSIVRQSDLVLLTIDLGSDDALDQVESVSRILEDSRIHLVHAASAERQDTQPGVVCCRTVLVANKDDAVRAPDNLEVVRELFHMQFPIAAASAVSGHGMEELRRLIFERLEIIRIYTKVPGKKLDPATAPFVLRKGSTVLDAARAVHRDFAHSLRFARLWSSPRSIDSVRHDGQMVERTHRLQDGDILELHE